ncbi:MAG: hypothetical protein V3U73_05140, partial [bacterium]
MGAYEDYCDLINFLNTHNSQQPRRKKHRLPVECYTRSDCEFFFTICVHRENGSPFYNEKLAKAVIGALLWRRQHHKWILPCYCLMPDHLHFIVQLPVHQIRYIDAGARGIVPEGILDHIGNFKKYTTTQIWWEKGGVGSLWQKSSYDRVIRYNNSADFVVRYILNNPVRKGLVER